MYLFFFVGTILTVNTYSVYCTIPDACFAPGCVHTTPQGLELHLGLYGKEEQVLLLEVPTPQRDLSCTCSCLNTGA